MSLPWLARNPRANRAAPYGAAQRHVVTAAGVEKMAADLERCPAHRVTPLYALPALARQLSIASLHVKDEAQRFGFGAFKALGGVYAIYSDLARRVADRTGATPDFAALMAGEGRAITGDLVFTTASSGNHGRSVAAGAKLFGQRCVIFLPGFTSAEKEAAIRARGAEVVRVDGDYDAAVAMCREVARQKRWVVISDTSWPGYETIPAAVMRGYTVLAFEALRQFAQATGAAAPSHVFVQAGVGGLAAAVIGYLWETLGATRPQFIVVEPASADCWFQSNLAGRPALASGDAATAMGGLACREISPMTWPVIGEGADWFMTIAEDAVAPAMRRMARPQPGDPVIVAGPSGCAGMAALLRVTGDAAARTVLHLDRAARVMLINSEGAAGEPDLFRQATGLSVAEATAAMPRPQMQ
ncbi:MAG: diaminopropionate ammonia-lyase [Alphaproteobacteria bacterium]|nr:diaminopropionate ammonia-lyase [Alphaproteobacteria bacterium]